MKFHKKIFSLLISAVIFTTLSFNVYANDITYSTNSGISITLPEEFADFATWNQAPEDSTGWKKMSFPNYKTMIDTITKQGVEFITLRNDMTNISGFQILIEKLNFSINSLTAEEIFSSYSEVLKNGGLDISTTPVYGYGISNINGQTFFKTYSESGESEPDILYTYLLFTKSNDIFEIILRNHNNQAETEYFDTLVKKVISTMSFSNELQSQLETISGESFHMIQGEHSGALDIENQFSSVSTQQANKTAPAKIKKTPYQAFISFEFPIWIILVALAFILFFGIKFSKKGEWQENPLSLETSKEIQGFCAVAIIIHHLAQELGAKAGVLSFFEDLGVLFVGVFFFFSGYGLYTSLKSKENYLKGFLKKRLTSILIPFYVCILIFMVNECIKGQTCSVLEFFAVITGFVLINSHMWYIVEIAILYLAFYFIYSRIKNRKTATAVMSIFVLILTVGSLLLKHGADMSSIFWFMGEWWYNTTFAFILGILISQNEEKCRNFARKNYFILLPVFILLTAGFAFLTKYALNNWSYWSEYPGYNGYKDKFLCLIIQLPWVLFFVVTLLLIMMKVRFGNPILKFLGTIALELYLTHNLFLTGLHSISMIVIKSNSLYITLTILLSIGFATIVSGIDKYIISLINGRFKKTALDETTALETKTSGRIHSIDVLRIIMAFLVVTIHIPFKKATGNVFITFGKTAVPFFLVVCGYLLYRKDTQEMMARLKKQTKRMCIFYIGGNLLYGIATALMELIDHHNLNAMKLYFTGDKIKDFLIYNMSPFSEHLWFLGSLLYALLLLMLLNKLKSVDYAMFAAPLLIAAYVVLSHLNAAEPYVLRNAILVGLPYVMMGMMIRRYEDKFMKIKTSILWILALVLCCTAIVELNVYKQGVGVPFVSCEILVYVIVLLCLKYPDFGRDTLAEKMGVELSLPIYILHIIPIMFLSYIIPSTVGILSNYGAITVFVLTALFAALYKAVKNAVVKKI